MFERWGRLVYRFRWPVLGAAVAALALSVLGTMAAGNVDAPNNSSIAESDRAYALARAELPQLFGSSGGSSFILVFGSKDLTAQDAAFEAAVNRGIAPLQADPRVTGVLTPYSAASNGLLSRDAHEVAVVVDLKDRSAVAARYVPSLRGKVDASPLSVVLTGNVPINQAFNTTLEADLQRAELISLPVALVLLLLIFRSGVAAMLPVAVGVLSIAGGIAGTILLSNVTYVSQYAFNIVTLVGLGVSIDYSLMFVSRFREELAAGAATEKAVATAMATAGRAITFSGISVAVGLSSLLFFQGTFLASFGIAGAMVVAIAVLYGVTLLPALLSVLGHRVNWLRLPTLRRPTGRGFWFTTASWVMRRPVAILVPCIALLLVTGIPFAHLRLAGVGVDGLPPANEARAGYDTLVRDFAGFGNDEIDVVAYFPNADPTSGSGPADIAALSRRIAAIPGVVRVQAPVLGPDIALLTAVSNLDASSDGSRAIVNAIRAENRRPGGAHVLVFGDTATDLDVIAFIRTHLITALGFVLAVTYIVLFAMTGSVVLPLKAVATNLLSITASFGALVWIFQDGHLSNLLGFSAQSIDPSVPVILFALVFGLSMDYEVLLLARIQERWVATRDNTRAVAEGLENSGRLITGAAAIMIAVFLAFGLAQDVLIKSIGIGIAIAIAIDATLVRALIVPAVMRVLGRFSWWAPGPLAAGHRRAGLPLEAPVAGSPGVM